MDAFLLHAVSEELVKSLTGGRLVRVFQESERRLILSFRTSSGNRHLLICLEPSLPRIHLVSEKGRAAAPARFCSLLKNRLSGAVLDGVEKEGMERVLMLRFQRRDELGRLFRFTLAAEMIPRVPNLIFIDEEGIIVDAFTRVNPSAGGRRSIKVGSRYDPPPGQAKEDPLTADRDKVEEIFSRKPAGDDVSGILLKGFFGLSPLMTGEVEARAGKSSRPGGPNTGEVWEELRGIMECYREVRFSPTVYMDEEGEKPVAVTPFPFVLYENHKAMDFESVSEALEYYYVRKSETEGTRRQAVELSQLCRRLLRKLSSRREALCSDIKEAKQAEVFKRRGDLILVNIGSIRKGMESVILTDLYGEPDEKVKVELNPSLDASANAQRCFKRYTKLKKKGQMAGKRLKETDKLVADLSKLDSDLEAGADPESVKAGLTDMGLLWEEEARGDMKRKSPEMGGIIRHTTREGWEILVGKNSRANDYLTTRVARRNDLWLHVRGQPGAHVIIRNPSGKAEIPRPVIEKAALLAALNSKSRKASKATVDYAFRKHVRKPKGAQSGTVTIKNPRTITVSLAGEIE